MEYTIIFIAVLGLLLSIYAYIIERKLEANKKYKAICDINDKISCSRAFESKYGKMLGISNSTAGIFFYILVIINSFFSIKYVLYLAVFSVLGSIILAYLSYVKLKTFCLVCTGVYIINVLLLIFSFIAL